MADPMTPAEQDKELREQVAAIIEYWDFSPLQDEDSRIERLKNEIIRLIAADRRRVALEARIDTATDILYGFSRTYKQKVTDSAGNVYADESHGYISKYEVQELVAELKAQEEEL